MTDRLPACVYLQAPYILIPTTTTPSSQTAVGVPTNANGQSTVTPPASGTVCDLLQSALTEIGVLVWTKITGSLLCCIALCYLSPPGICPAHQKEVC